MTSDSSPKHGIKGVWLPRPVHHLVFLRQVRSPVHGTHQLNWAAWPVCPKHQSPPPRSVIVSVYHHTWLLNVSAGDQTQVRISTGQAYFHRSHPPLSPVILLMEDTFQCIFKTCTQLHSIFFFNLATSLLRI